MGAFQVSVAPIEVPRQFRAGKGYVSARRRLCPAGIVLQQLMPSGGSRTQGHGCQTYTPQKATAVHRYAAPNNLQADGACIRGLFSFAGRCRAGMAEGRQSPGSQRANESTGKEP